VPRRGDPLCVPNVIGRSLAEAKRMLEAAELSVLVTERTVSGPARERVIDQRPGPGAAVGPWFVIRLIVAAD
jgi:beta-lactam-binding protein with PASTA domain